MEETTPDKRKLFTPKKVVISILLLGFFLAGVFYAISNNNHDTNPIPQEIRAQLPFSPFILPLDSKKYTADSFKFSTVENNVKILSYVINTNDGNKVAVSQYAQPLEFEEIPEYKNRFLNNVAKQYAAAQTSNGTIYLGKQAKQGNKQLGVMLERGLLVFLSPEKDMDEAKWRELGDELEIRKVSD